MYVVLFSCFFLNFLGCFLTGGLECQKLDWRKQWKLTFPEILEHVLKWKKTCFFLKLAFFPLPPSALNSVFFLQRRPSSNNTTLHLVTQVRFQKDNIIESFNQSDMLFLFFSGAWFCFLGGGFCSSFYACLTWQPSWVIQSVSQTSEEITTHMLLQKMTQMCS